MGQNRAHVWISGGFRVLRVSRKFEHLTASNAMMIVIKSAFPVWKIYRKDWRGTDVTAIVKIHDLPCWHACPGTLGSYRKQFHYVIKMSLRNGPLASIAAGPSPIGKSRTASKLQTATMSAGVLHSWHIDSPAECHAYPRLTCAIKTGSHHALVSGFRLLIADQMSKFLFLRCHQWKGLFVLAWLFPVRIDSWHVTDVAWADAAGLSLPLHLSILSWDLSSVLNR